MARILVIDDSPTAVQFVKSALRHEAHVVEALTSFVNLTSAVRDDPPDLILLDLTIPALSGVTMGKLIRKHEAREVPILVYSSRPEPELAEAARAVRAVGYVSKGSSPADLRDAITQALRARVAVG